MTTQAFTTEFAPPARATAREINRQYHELLNSPLLSGIVDAVPDGILVLNPERQIVLANRSILAFVGVTEPQPVLGLRPGEALSCIHADENPAGCGTTTFCSTCGAVKAILASQQGRADIQECRLIRKTSGEALDLRVWATPFQVGGLRLTIFTLMDISNEKRRKALERIFFHAILNTASGVKGFAELMQTATPDETNQYKEIIFSLAQMTVAEINSQRILTAAENNELIVKPEVFRSRQMLEKIIDLYSHHEVAAGRRLQLDPGVQDLEITSDPTLLRRVIGNLVKNALEACRPGETVTVGCSRRGSQIEFWVHNPNEMPPEVKLQIFQRSFSTKGSGRGLGTYSVKLLSERYLKGAVTFASTAAGTTFRAAFPPVCASA